MRKTKTTNESAGIPYGWCMTGDHDTARGRGACPVQVGSQKPCSCECHKGATEARGFLGFARPSAQSPASPDLGDDESVEVPEEAPLPEAPVGEQIPLL